MAKENEVVINKLDMVHEFISEVSLLSYFEKATYQHLPEISDEVVLAFGTNNLLDGKSRSLLILRDGTLIRTARTLTDLYDRYGRKFGISNWLHWQKTIAHLTSSPQKLAPYVTYFSGFIQIHGGCIVNQNYVGDYEHSKTDSQYETHTTVTLVTGAYVELSIGYRSFQRKLHVAASQLIGLRKLYRWPFEDNRTDSFYDVPVKINPFIIQDLAKNNVQEHSIDLSNFNSALFYFSQLENALAYANITSELLAGFNKFTQELIKKELGKET